MLFQRPQAAILRRRLHEPPRHLIIVAGPRQVGKTTLVRDVVQPLPHRYVAVDNRANEPAPALMSESSIVGDTGSTVRDADWLVRQWQVARAQANESRNGFVFILDEIQKVHNWSDVVKGLWDEDRAKNLSMHVVLLGSSPLLIQQGLTESLAGRFESMHVTHWSYTEMREAFALTLEEYIYFGGYPGSVPYIRDEERWRAYVRSSLIDPNIEKDILMMHRVEKHALLKQLFLLGCEFSGQILSYSKMQGQLQDAGNTVTLAHYLDLLSGAGLITGLQKYAGNQVRRRASSPKLNVLNTALISAGSGYTYSQATADRTYWGRLVESTVGAHLCNSAPQNCRIYYWRESPHEVDFVIECGRRVCAIEVSTGAQFQTVGMEEFAKRFRVDNRVRVGTGGIAVADFLSFPADHWLE